MGIAKGRAVTIVLDDVEKRELTALTRKQGRRRLCGAIAVLIVLLAAAPVFARKATHHRYKRDAAKSATISNVERGETQRHSDDVALDRKIGSIFRGC